MTIGQRIAQKRKEQDLSQEALGDRLGVSRQSIYKWESGAALPEIEKLVALSRLFGVSVGWLLGVEERAPEAPPADSGELTAPQLAMVEEIVDRYIAAQPKPLSPKRRRVFKLAVAGAAVCLALALFSLFQRLDRVDQQYSLLQSSVNSVTSSVNSQINDIANRVETVLKAQDSLVAKCGTEIVHVSLRDGENRQGGVVIFSAYAVPKTYEEGMTAEFVLDNGTGGVTISPGSFRASTQTFSTDSIAAPLTDDIALSVIFTLPDGTRKTQFLESYQGLYTGSLPMLRIDHYLTHYEQTTSGTLLFQDLYFAVTHTPGMYAGQYGDAFAPAEVREIRVGLFRGQKLVAWAEPSQQPATIQGYEADTLFFLLPDTEVEAGSDDAFTIAALVTDQYDRTAMYTQTDFTVDLQQQMIRWSADLVTPWSNPAEWIY